MKEYNGGYLLEINDRSANIYRFHKAWSSEGSQKVEGREFVNGIGYLNISDWTSQQELCTDRKELRLALQRLLPKYTSRSTQEIEAEIARVMEAVEAAELAAANV